MRCKSLQKRSPGKTTECSKHLRHIATEKDILSELNRCIFQISPKYIKLVVPKILFILVLCSFNFYFKITWRPPSRQNYPPPKKIKIPDPSLAKTFLKFLPSPPSPPSWRGEGCMPFFSYRTPPVAASIWGKKLFLKCIYCIEANPCIFLSTSSSPYRRFKALLVEKNCG